MKLTNATLVKLATSDGFWRIKEHRPVQPGKVYIVDLDTIRVEKCWNIPTGKLFECELVEAWDTSGPLPDDFRHMPTELLELHTYLIREGHDTRSITCLHCGLTSYHPQDMENKYCGKCHIFHDDIWPPSRVAWAKGEC